MTPVNATITRTQGQETFTLVFDDGDNTARFNLPEATLRQLRDQIDQVIPR